MKTLFLQCASCALWRIGFVSPISTQTPGRKLVLIFAHPYAAAFGLLSTKCALALYVR